MEYISIIISEEEAVSILEDEYGIKGDVDRLPGEIDFNFKVTTKKELYILKISRPDFDLEYIDYQNSTLNHLAKKNFGAPVTIPALDSDSFVLIKDSEGRERVVRLLSWISGRMWSSVNPISVNLLENLGNKAGQLTNSLMDFDHHLAHRQFEWDIAEAGWTLDYLDLFDTDQKKVISYFQDKFISHTTEYNKLRKSIVHNDVNDNNVVVSNELISPEVLAIIDFGDAIYTQTINDLAIAIAYAVMGKPDVIGAAMSIVKGYNEAFSITEDELNVLYSLVAMRLVISVTKSVINKQKEPDNKYLLVSEAQAWEVLVKWKVEDENFATYCFRHACGFISHPNYKLFLQWAKNKSFNLKGLFPETKNTSVKVVDMSVGSPWLGHETEYNDNDLMDFKLNCLALNNPDCIIAGGYLEPRPIYTTDVYKAQSNNGNIFRTVHLGIDFWLPALTPVHSLFDATVQIAINDAGDKEYGGLLVLKHVVKELTFYTLYGHQSVSSISKWKKGDKIRKGEKISELGFPQENGNWASHLHFQVMLDMLGNEHEFPGVTYPDQIDIWERICPDPNLLFKLESLEPAINTSDKSLMDYRKKHLGSSLSLSYDVPINVVRGSYSYLFDNMGRKFLDTVNNVAHVGHEHPRTLSVAKNQISLLNTNTRYLHKNINEFAEELLKTMPESLSVVHFVNSGSEANELALRMAKAKTDKKDIIALEVGYHGNTQGCIDISSYKFDGKGGSGAPEHTHIVPLPDTFRGMYRDDNAANKYASHIQDSINHIKDKDRGLAAFICESIVSCGGQIELPDGYLAKAYEFVREAGGVCIADEVQVGVGRVGHHWWGFQLHNVVPDIVTIGKPIGNGHPLAAVVCTREIADAFANGMEYFNTFGGNPVSCAIGTEVLRIVADEGLKDNALEVGEFLKKELRALALKYPIIGDVRGQGLFLGFELVDENMIPMIEKTSYLANRMKELGILMSVDGKDNNVIKIKPPIVFSQKNAVELITRLECIFGEDYMTN